ncbi:metal-dependent hydrolase [Halostella sp. PRR32]|uniref:metal-dependent hydrolase n=1 Tax=Halostella sp. PRR32 TaxID=3098147 RepID=UPI00110D6A7E|nr:metal-dependent hydrolase [Halostella sp. PRR32]
MWPWEHLALGYVVYSLLGHALERKAPSDIGAVAVGVGTQLPDLVDKPLSWGLGITETGYSVGHSLFLAPVVCLAAVALGRRYGDGRIVVAFAVGYLSHLFGDIVYPLFLGRGVAPSVVLWPVVTQPPSNSHLGFVQLVTRYLVRYARQMAALDVTPYLLFQLCLGLCVLLLWLYDGMPGAALYRIFARRATR